MTKTKVQEFIEKANELDQLGTEVKHEIKEAVEQMAKARRVDIWEVLTEIFGTPPTGSREP